MLYLDLLLNFVINFREELISKMKKFNTVLLILTILALVIYVASPSEAKKVRVAVHEFVSKTSDILPKMLPEITDIFSKILSSSSNNNIDVISSNSPEKLQTLNIQNALELGKNSMCQYVVLGTVMKNSNYALKGGDPMVGTTFGQKLIIEVRVIDVAKGEIVLSASGIGTGEYFSKTFWGLGISEKKIKKMIEDSEAKFKDVQRRSIDIAASKISEKISVALVGEYPEVFSIQSQQSQSMQTKANTKSKTTQGSAKKSTHKNILGTVRINRGSSAGIHEKVLYRIYIDGEEIFDINGTSLGHEKLNIAIAEVRDTAANFCNADVKAGYFNKIRTGDKAEQITEEEAQLIIDSNNFIRNRFSEFLN